MDSKRPENDLKRHSNTMESAPYRRTGIPDQCGYKKNMCVSDSVGGPKWTPTPPPGVSRFIEAHKWEWCWISHFKKRPKPDSAALA
jgi:hypothetical protein